MDSRRTAEGFGTKNKKDSRVRGRHFSLGKQFSDESPPAFTPRVVHASGKLKRRAGRHPGRMSLPVQAFCSVGQYPIENHRLKLGITLPELYLKDLPCCTSVFFFFKTSKLPYSTSSPVNTVVSVREQPDDAMSIAIDGFWGRTDTRRSRITALESLWLNFT